MMKIDIFLSHYFRNNYDEALLNYPYINSNIQITRVEVWVTNRNNQIEDVRNILALQDLGETDNVSSNVNILSPPNSYLTTPTMLTILDQSALQIHK